MVILSQYLHVTVNVQDSLYGTMGLHYVYLVDLSPEAMFKVFLGLP